MDTIKPPQNPLSAVYLDTTANVILAAPACSATTACKNMLTANVTLAAPACSAKTACNFEDDILRGPCFGAGLKRRSDTLTVDVTSTGERCSSIESSYDEFRTRRRAYSNHSNRGLVKSEVSHFALRPTFLADFALLAEIKLGEVVVDMVEPPRSIDRPEPDDFQTIWPVVCQEFESNNPLFAHDCLEAQGEPYESGDFAFVGHWARGGIERLIELQNDFEDCPQVKLLASLMLHLVSVYRHCTAVDIVLELSKFCLANGLSWLKDWVVAQVGWLSQTAQGAMDLPVELSGSFNPCVENSLVSRFFVLMSTVSAATVFQSLGVFPDWVISYAIRAREALGIRMGADTFFSHLAGFIRELATSIRSCVAEGTLRPLFRESMKPSEWIHVSQVALYNESIVDAPRSNRGEWFLSEKKAGVIPSFFVAPISAANYPKLLDYLANVGRSYMKIENTKWNTEVGVMPTIQKVVLDLDAKAMKFRAAANNGSQRPQPFSLYLWGKPGTGKSVFLSKVLSNLGLALGYSGRNDESFLYQSGMNFDDNFHGQPHLVFDDVDNAPVKQGDPSTNYAAKWMLYVNTKSVNIESADIRTKGALFADFRTASFVSNHEAPAGLKGLLTDPDAFLRRFNYKINVVANPKYMTKSGGIDFKNVPPGEEAAFFDLYQVMSNSTELTLIEKGLTQLRLMQILVPACKAHVERECAVANASNKAALDVCRVCGVLGTLHRVRCPGDEEPVSTEVAQEAQGDLDVVVTVTPFKVGAAATVLAIFISMFGVDHFLSGCFLLVCGLVGWSLRSLVQVPLATLGVSTALTVLEMMSLKRFAYNLIKKHYIMEMGEFKLVAREIEQAIESRAVETFKQNKMVVSGLIAVSTLLALWGTAKVLSSVVAPRKETLVVPVETEAVTWQRETAPLRGVGLPRNPVGTMSRSDAISEVRKRLWWIKCEETGFRMHCLHVGGCLLVFPKHILSEGRVADGRLATWEDRLYNFRIWKGTTAHRFQARVGNNMVISTGRDMVGVSAPAAGLDTRMSLIADELPATYDEGVVVLSGELEEDLSYGLIEGPSLRSRRDEKGDAQEKVVWYIANTEPGDCGAPLLGRVGKRWYVLGFHTQLNFCPETQRITHSGEILTKPILDDLKRQLAAAERRVCEIEPVVDVLALSVQGGSDLKEDIPAVSSAGTAVRRSESGYLPVGTLSRFKGSTMTTGCRRTILHDKFEDLEEAWTGQKDYFAVPKFRGKMTEGGDWIDPFVLNLEAASNLSGHEDVWQRAFDDYICGFEDWVVKSDVPRQPLTFGEAIVGVPGVVRATDLKTSSGLPYNTPKSNFIKFSGEGQLLIDPRVKVKTLEILKHWEEGRVYMVPCNHTMKDEVMKRAKVEGCQVRIFNVVPMAFNLALKMLFGPLLASFVSNWRSSECAAGFNFGGPVVDEMMDYFQELDPSFERLSAGDYANFDIKQCTRALIFSARVAERQAQCHGYSSVDSRACFFAVLSCCFTLRVIKGDVFRVSFGNPSGGYLTLYINSIVNSGNHRYAYFRNLDDLKLKEVPFRTMVHLLTLGDDNESTAADAQYFSQLVMGKYMPEIGHVYTDSNKLATSRAYSPLSEADFAKRSMWFDDQCRRWKAKLSKKSLAKMLRYAGKSSLSAGEQEAQLLANVVRESYLHGREFFDQICDRVKAEVECAPQIYPCFKCPTYEELDTRFVQGTFTTWVDDLHELVDRSLPVRVDSSVPLEAQADRVDQVVAEVASMPAVDTDEVAIETLRTIEDPTEFLTRKVYVGSFTMASTDTIGADVLTLGSDLLSLWASTSLIANKIQYFRYLRSNIKVTVQFSTSSTYYGGYVASFAPLGAGAGTLPSLTYAAANMFNVNNSFNAEHFVMDMSSSNTFEIELPWVSEYNAADLSTMIGSPKWYMWVNCLAPVTDVTNPAGTASVSAQLYVQLMPDYELVVPVAQAGSKHKLKKEKGESVVAEKRAPSGKISAMASTVSKIADVAGNVPFLAPFAATAKVGAGMVESIASMFGYTRESDPKPPVHYMSQNFSSLANCDGMDGSEIVGLSVTNNVSIDPRIGGGDPNDEMAFASIFPRQGAVYNYSWSPTSAAYTDLLNFPISPIYGPSVGTEEYVLAPVGYVAVPFTFWCGTMEYEVMAFASNFHRGKLVIAWSSSPSALTSEAITLSPNVILDLEVDTSVKFEVGWMSHDPALRLGLNTTPNGYLHVLVASPLSSQSASNVQIWILASAKPDLQLSVPRSDGLDNSGTANVDSDFRNAVSVAPQALGDGFHATEVVKLAGLPMSVNLCPLLAGETVGSVKMLLQKFSRSYNVSITGALSATLPMPFYTPAPGAGFYSTTYNGTLTYSGTTPWTWFGHYSALYCGVRGSMRFKVFATPASGTVAGTLPPNTLAVSSRIGVCGAVPVTASASALFGDSTPGFVASGDMVGQGFEFLMPNYDSLKFRNNYWFGANQTTIGTSNIGTAQQKSVVCAIDGNDSSTLLQVFSAGGPDAICVKFLRSPIITIL
jgi:hypothetical protein